MTSPAPTPGDRCTVCDGRVSTRCVLCRGNPAQAVTVEQLARAVAQVDRATRRHLGAVLLPRLFGRWL